MTVVKDQGRKPRKAQRAKKRRTRMRRASKVTGIGSGLRRWESRGESIDVRTVSGLGLGSLYAIL
jgi:hypothetical protein